MVVKAQQEDPKNGQEALNQLCTAYWMPLYAFARRKGHSPEDSEDLTQGFLSHFISKDSFAGVDRNKGRLRNYLRRSMDYYMRDQWRRQTTQAKGEGKGVVRGLSVEQAEQIISNDSAWLTESPEEAFQRRWAMVLLDRVMERLAQHYSDKGEPQMFEQLKPFLEGTRHNDESYAECAEKLGLTANVIRVRTTRLRKRFRALLIEEVRATTSDEEVEDELRFLFTVFQRRPAA